MPDLHPPCASCGTRWFHGHTSDCPTRAVRGELPDWFVEIKEQAIETEAATPAKISAPRRSSRTGVWCTRGEHERCRSDWGIKPCTCKCHAANGAGRPVDAVADQQIRTWNAGVRFDASLRGLPKAEREMIQQAASALSTEHEDDSAAGRLAFARILMNGNGHPHELRALRDDARFSGVYSTPEELAEAAGECDGEVDAFVTINPVSLEPKSFARALKNECAGEPDVTQIRWFPVDVDVYKVPSATIEEVLEFLDARDWPKPVVMASGGGYWLLYRYDAENTDEETRLRERALAELHERFPAVDTVVSNASRIVRFAYTANLKNLKNNGGARRSYLVTPKDMVPEILTRAQLEALAGEVSEEPEPRTGIGTDVDAIIATLAERDITLDRGKDARKAPGTIYQLSDCPFHPNDTHRSAATLIAWADGNVSFSCRGQRCRDEDNRIMNLLEKLDIRMTRESKTGGLTLIKMSDVRSRRIEFYWAHRKVIGDLNCDLGDEKIGKGLLMVRNATDLSTGKMRGRPAKILYASIEERLETVVKPRFEAAGADPDYVRFLPMGSLGLPDAIPELAAACKDEDIEHVFLDPYNKHFSADLDPNKARDVGIVLGELAKMAGALDLTMDGSLHTNRSGSMSPRQMMAHSLEFARSTRSTVLIGRTKDDNPDERTLIHCLPNYSGIDPALRARIRLVTLAIEGEPTKIAVLDIGEETEAEPEDVFLKEADREGAIAEAKAARGKKAACIQNILGRWRHLSMPPTVPASEMQSAIKDFAGSTAVAARKALGIEVTSDQDPDSGEVQGWIWHFPEQLGERE